MTVDLKNCHSCREVAVRDVLDCGPQPLCNRFLADAAAQEEVFPLVISQCDGCGLIQISHPIPADEMRPRHAWISYNEPDAHLEALVDQLASLPGISRESAIGAVVFGSDKTLERFEARGFRNIWRIDLRRDLEAHEEHAGTETIQDRLTPESAAQITRQHCQFDVLVVRHMLEHAHDVRRFLAAIRQMLKPGGYAVFEVPDCEQGFATCDYSIIWEEHVFYFMPATFRHCLASAGYEVMDLQRPTYSLVALTRVHRQESSNVEKLPASVRSGEIERMRVFASSLPQIQQATSAYLSEIRAQTGLVAFFGAGHMACTYINLLGLNQVLDCLVDDHPQKRGLLMPGSHLPIVGADALEARGVKACLSALSAESEVKVAQNNARFLSDGGKFLSIFAGRPNSLPIRPCA